MNISRNGTIDLTNLKYVDAKPGCDVKNGDVLFNNTNSPELIGKTAVCSLDLPLAYSNHMTRLRVNSAISAAFLANQLHWLWMSGYFRHRCINHVNQASLSTRPLAETVPIALPPLPEQRRIVAEIEKQLTRLDAASTQLQLLRRNLDRCKTSALRALTNIRPPSDSSLPSIPKHWTWCKLGDLLIDIEAGMSFKCEERPPRNGETGVLKVSAVTWGEFDEAESKTCMDPERISEKLLVQPGDFLFSRANTIELVGACVIVRSITQRLMLSDKTLRLKTRNVGKKWLLYVLRSPWGRHEIERLSTGNQHSMRNIGQERIKGIRIPMPPIDEQRQLVSDLEDRLSAYQQLAMSADQALTHAARLRQAILTKAFSGRLVPQDPNDEPASVLLERICAKRNHESKRHRTPKSDHADQAILVR